MPSFDVVSKVDMQEVDNAVNQTRKEIEQRFDFKGTHNEIDQEKDALVIFAADDYKLAAVIDEQFKDWKDLTVVTCYVEIQTDKPGMLVSVDDIWVGPGRPGPPAIARDRRCALRCLGWRDRAKVQAPLEC